MEKIYNAANPAEAHLLVALLSAKGIQALVQGDKLPNLQGMNMEPEIWILNADDAVAARKFIEEEFIKKRREQTDSAVDTPNKGEDEQAATPATGLDTSDPRSDGELVKFEWLVLISLLVLPSLYSGARQYILGALGDYADHALHNTLHMIGVAILIYYVLRRRPGALEKAGIRPVRPLLDPLLGIGIWLLSRIAWSFMWGVLHGFDPQVVKWLTSPIGYVSPLPTPGMDIAFIVLSALATGFAEELTWRGFVISRLEAFSKSDLFLSMTSAALFALLHIYQSLYGVMTAFLYGIIWAVFFLWMRRIWPLAIAHAIVNILASFSHMQ